MLVFVMGVISRHNRMPSLIDRSLKKIFVCLKIHIYMFSQMYVSYVTYSKNEIVTTDKSLLARNLSAPVYS